VGAFSSLAVKPGPPGVKGSARESSRSVRDRNPHELAPVGSHGPARLADLDEVLRRDEDIGNRISSDQISGNLHLASDSGEQVVPVVAEGETAAFHHQGWELVCTAGGELEKRVSVSVVMRA
jgi:hypothetical protein